MPFSTDLSAYLRLKALMVISCSSSTQSRTATGIFKYKTKRHAQQKILYVLL